MPYRYDKGELRAPHKTPEGYLYADAYATRAGVFNYRRPDGTVRRELRHPDEVFKADSTGSLGRKPVTLRHPEEPVTATNFDQYGVGVVGERIVEEAEGGFVQVSLAIHRKDAIEAIEKQGLRELSCGYTCDLDMTPGEWNGERYDAQQKNIHYNHLALVERGRAGADVRLRMDADDAEMVEDTQNDKKEPPREGGVTTHTRRDTMPKITIDGVTYDVEDANFAQKVADVVRDRDQLKADAAEQAKQLEQLTPEKQRADAAEQKRDEYKGQLDALTVEHDKLKQQVTTDEDRTGWYNERTQLLDVAKKLKVDKADDLDNAALKKAIVQTHNPDLKLDSVSEGYVDGAFEMIKQSLGKRDQHLDSVHTVPATPPQGSQGSQGGDWKTDVNDARKAQLEQLDGSAKLLQ